MILLPIGVAFALLAEPIVELLFGDDYTGAVQPLRVLAPLTVLYGVSYFTGASLTARDRPGSFGRAAAVALVVNLGANLVLIPSYGATGAAVAAVVSAAVLVLLTFRSFARVAGRIDVARIAGGPLAGAAAMAAALLLVDVPLAPALVLGGVVYALGLVALELVAWPEDVALARAVFLSRRQRAVGAGP